MKTGRSDGPGLEGLDAEKQVFGVRKSGVPNGMVSQPS